MTPEEQRRMKRLENAVLDAYAGVDGLLVDIHPKPGPNGRVQWARTRKVLADLKVALVDTAPDQSGTIPMVLFR